MAKSLDFNKIKKNYLNITLNDENQTKLSVFTPTKILMSELMSNLPDDMSNTSEEDLAELYDLSARLMSRNKQGITVTGEQLEEILDVEDLVIFFNAYTDFITELMNEKN